VILINHDIKHTTQIVCHYYKY